MPKDYLQSCRHEGWSSVAKFLTEDVPQLLKSEDLKDIQEVLSHAFKSPPSELRGLITWIAEVCRQEDGNLTLSEDEKGRLAIKANILEQIQTTGLFKHVTRWLDSKISCCNSLANLGDKDMLPALTAPVCCQVADLLTVCGRLGLSGGKYCSQIDVKHLNADSENPVTLVSGTITTSGGSEQGVDVLVPLCQREPSRLCLSNEGHCIGMHPSTANVLTVLLLALPLHTWSGIKEEKLRVEALSLLATEDLPPLLQEEIWTFRSSLTGVYRLKWLVSVNFCGPSGLQETNDCFQQRKVPMRLLLEKYQNLVVPATEVVSNDNVQIHKWKQPTVCFMKANLDASVKKNIGTSVKSLLQHLWLFLAARNLM
ncbi:hypothetical protein JHK82_031803 [Glycine max]|nr:hypothetical protein JHK86_031895 [Glycine max]KAG5125066.1 hypothetical protein JHK82_031803 [Glycine max]KAG5146492.1 hypothetical protein JHK84_032035 [Glycine max]KAH1226181.1 Glutathione gamma-glutamylcysteinyltransferase 3 [Glycine max]